MAFRLAELFVELSARGFTKVEAGIARIRQGLTALSRATPNLAGFGVPATLSIALYKIVTASEEADKAQRRLDATIRLLGTDARVTSESVNEMARALAATSEFDDDAIARASATMLEFGNITQSTLSRAVPIAVDLASRTGDLDGAMRALGAALSDPAENVGLLRRQFRALSVEVMNAAEQMAKSGDLIGAQKLIMDELAKHTEGMAAAMVTDMDRAKSAVGEAAEAIGKALAPAITWFAKSTQAAAEFAQEMSNVKTRSEFMKSSASHFVFGMMPGKVQNALALDIAERELAERRARQGAKRLRAPEEAAAEADEQARTQNEYARRKQEEADKERMKLAKERAEHERNKHDLLETIRSNTLEGFRGEAARATKEVDDLTAKLKEFGATQDEIATARGQMFDKFHREQTERREDLMRGMLGDIAPDSSRNPMRRRLEIEFKAEEMRRQIDAAFPGAEDREAMLGMVTEMRDLQQKQLTQSTRRSPEFVGITEMASRIQQAVGGTGREQVEKQQVDLMKKLEARAAGSGLNVNIRNVSELQGLGAVGP